jgi:ubiquinone/menaquinone biosynthesis C-methylase UbiE
MKSKNLEKKTISNFGLDWRKFDQSSVSNEELNKIFKNYFKLFPAKFLTKKSIGLDIGRGSGRWSKFILPLVKKLYMIDASYNSVATSRKNLINFKNKKIFQKNIYSMNFRKNSFDFVYCLGALHHINNIEIALKKINQILKKNSPFLIYLYYAFDNKPLYFKFIWKISNLIRILVSKFPFVIKSFICDILAFFIYWPCARISKILSLINISVTNFPLSYYKECIFIQ